MKNRAAGVVRTAGRSIDKTKTRDPQAEFDDFVEIIEAGKKTCKRIEKLLLKAEKSSHYSKDENAVIKRILEAEKKNLDRAGEIRERNEKLWTKEHWKKISALHRRGAGSKRNPSS